MQVSHSALDAGSQIGLPVKFRVLLNVQLDVEIPKAGQAGGAAMDCLLDAPGWRAGRRVMVRIQSAIWRCIRDAKSSQTFIGTHSISSC